MISQPLVTGSVVKIWNENRGHDYVIVGIQGRSGHKKLGLVKNTCINNDGSFHAATRKIHSWIKVEQMEDFGTAPRVVRVEGSRVISRNHVTNFVRSRCGNRSLRSLKASDEVYPDLGSIDARSATSYV
ncbi:MAG: hypothetical protein DRQ78_08725 [Epsilonproteobacteria bacterium]|nr:MAG: hypothetical protein DRQ78_08725 [Campylobacterota bacterium]